ncbi:MAG: T9SS C-terminal target domain-containing protein [Candidatus Zixiibacteriota bacterium]|nr:MAG: T9SS C-terminal target domain-containing protein [candidate division Zixibacteria bacterium]
MQKLALALSAVCLLSAVAAAAPGPECPAGLTTPVSGSVEKPSPPLRSTDDWTITDSLHTSVSNPYGLAYDGSYFWVSNYLSSASSDLQKVDPATGATVQIIASPSMWPMGLAWTGTHLWCGDFIVGYCVYPNTCCVCKIDLTTGQVVDTLLTRYTYYSGGLAWDGQYLWYGRKTASTPPCECWIYKMDPETGNHLDSIAITTGDVSGLEYYDGHLYYSNYHTDIIYKITTAGVLVDQSPAPATVPRGLTVRNGCLWNVDDNTWLYEMTLAGAGLSVALTPHNPPIQIPAAGGSFTTDVNLSNGTTAPLTTDAWIYIRMPNGMPYPILQRPDLMLPAGASIVRVLTQNVPAVALPGTYYYVADAGDYPSAPAAADSFPFTKLSAGAGLGADDWQVWGWDEAALPQDLTLAAHPNPFNPSTAIRYDLPQAGRVRLAVYDTAGREVATLVDGWRTAGTHEAVFAAGDLASGLYLVRLESGARTTTGKLMLIK